MHSREPAEAPRLRGVELVLIGAARDPAAELGIEIDTEQERLETADIFEKLGLAPEDLPGEPLEKGRWR